MTALCGGGTSAPKLGIDLALNYSAGRLYQLLLAAGVEELSAWLPLVGIIPVVASHFCTSDPPTMVALTQAESDALANNTFGADFLNGIGKFKDVLLNLIWNDICQCTSGTYTPPVPPAVDPNTPVFQVPAPPVSVPCFIGTTAHPNQTSTTTGISGVLNDIHVIRATLVDLVISSAPVIGTGAGVNYTLDQYDYANVKISALPFAVLATQPLTHYPFNLLPNTRSIVVSFVNGGGTGTTQLTYHQEFYCGGAQPGAQSPCCPPDGATQAYLDLIFKQVNLIQRQLAPFAYVSGTVHTGLSGAGSLAISGLLGASVHCTTIPASYGRSGTNPTEYFDMGYLTFGVADGFPTAYRLERENQVMLPARASVYTDLDYDLSPGVVVTITELLRES